MPAIAHVLYFLFIYLFFGGGGAPECVCVWGGVGCGTFSGLRCLHGGNVSVTPCGVGNRRAGSMDRLCRGRLGIRGISVKF